MSDKITLQEITTLQNQNSAIAALNANFELLAEKIDTLLSRDGDAPNQMEANLDMNSNRINNLPAPVNTTEPARLAEIQELVSGEIPAGSIDGDRITSNSLPGDRIEDATVTYSKLPTMAQSTINGRAAGAGTGVRQDLTADQVRDILGTLIVVQCASRTALKALDTTKATLAYLTQGKRQGMFAWTAGDYSTQITADTTEGMYVKADAIAATAGSWIRVTERITPQMCGAVVDGVTNDYSASLAAFELAVRERLEWHCPKGNYLWNLSSGTALWDPTYLESGGRRAIRMTGAGTRATAIEITNATSIAWQIASTVDWFDFHLRGLTVKGSFNFPLLVIGKNDYSDPVNMLFIEEVSVENSFNGSSNVACRLNYIAGGVTNNFRCASYALAVMDVLTAVNGTALECRQVSFVNFNGGAFGNADRAVDFKDGFSYACVFNSPTLENANYCISNRSANSGAHTFNGPQLTNCLIYEVYSSAALGGRHILIVNPNWDGTLEVDPSNYQQVLIKDDSTVATPSAPATTVSVTNTTGRDVLVTYWGLSSLSSITLNGLGDGISATSGSFVLRAGKSVAFAYTGTLTWRWRNNG